MDALEGAEATRIGLVNLDTGDTRLLTFGPNVSPKFSPDRRQIAFLSDRHKPGDSQLYLLDPASGAVRYTMAVDGWVEYLRWSPDGSRILLGVAGHGADLASAQGAVSSQKIDEFAPRWMPVIDTGAESYRWRRAWVFDLASQRLRQVSGPEINIWEAVWCGNEAISVVASPGPGLRYAARVALVELDTGLCREINAPQDQLGWLAASPSGKHLAFVEALSSDRGIVAGDLRVIDISSGRVARVPTAGVDITYTEWRSNRYLLVAGHRGFETVVGRHGSISGAFSEVWSNRDITTGGRYIIVSGFGDAGDCVLVGESFVKAPEIAVIRQGAYHPVKSFDLGYSEQVRVIGAVDRLSWKSPAGLEIQSWLLRPQGASPYSVVMFIHGGPVWHSRPSWLGRAGPILLLVKRGYAVFLANPRGSAGRWQAFVRPVLGDMGGADTYDLLSGLDHLVELGLADPDRLGVTGASYGGFMTSWLITQDSRFAAAVSVAPANNHVSSHLLSNIPHFVDLFLADTYTNPGGNYFKRSPIMRADQVGSPTLNICDALDQCTPPEEAKQFHNALLENGVTSVLVTYPEEGARDTQAPGRH
jgi:dipeptidyl aminopeptidase/acylaminoacyl peptidase